MKPDHGTGIICFSIVAPRNQLIGLCLCYSSLRNWFIGFPPIMVGEP